VIHFPDVKCFATVYNYTVTWQADAEMDEKKTKSMLIDESAAMRRRIAELETLEAGQNLLQDKLRKLEHDLRERTKKLVCLYAISDVIEKSGSALEEILQGIINLIPAAWQYPEIACGRVINGTKEFRTDNFRETRFKQVSDIIVQGNCVGAIEVFYLEERTECDEGPFLKEERQLINAVAERLGKIIERKTIVEALKESERNYRSIFENAVEGIYQSTPEGRFLSVNPALARMMGFASPEEMIAAYTDIGKQHYVNSEDRRFFKELIEMNGIVKAFVTKLYKKDGSIIWTSRSGRVVRDAAGKVLYYEGTVEDITEQRKAEEEKRNNEKLNAALEMAGTICHEMNQPLQVIIGRIDLLSMGHIDERTYKSLEIMKDQVRKMGIITKKLMGLRTYSTNEYAGNTRIVDINPGRWSEDDLDHLIREAARIEDVGERIVFFSTRFLGTGYRESTLVGGIETPEILVVNLEEVDCFTFIDYVEAMRLSRSFSEFKDNLKKVRYQSGVVAYAQRNHFFTDWIEFNKEFVEDVSREIGGQKTEKSNKTLNIKEDGTFFLEGISPREREIFFIPTGSVDEAVVERLQNGDYAGIYTEKEGLDVSHVGIIIKKEGNIFLRHASSLEANRKVIDQDLKEYLTNKPGLLVLRAKN